MLKPNCDDLSNDLVFSPKILITSCERKDDKNEDFFNNTSRK